MSDATRFVSPVRKFDDFGNRLQTTPDCPCPLCKNELHQSGMYYGPPIMIDTARKHYICDHCDTWFHEFKGTIFHDLPWLFASDTR